MKAVILAGGKGTRMGEFTKEIPKPMLAIGDKPLLEHQINLLKRYGIKQIYILVNYLKDSIIEYFGNGENFGISIEYYEEKEPLRTVGGIKEIENRLNEDFIVFYGDVMIDMHLGRLINFHNQQKSDCTLVLHPNDHPFDSDLVDIDDSCKISAFYPKPHNQDKFYKNLVNAGAYILSPKIFEFIEKGKKADFGKDIFPVIYSKINMMGYNTAEYLKDMGTPERWAEVNSAYLSGKISHSNYENKQTAIFLDRDGVINEERGLFKNPDDLIVFDFAGEAIRKINKSDYKAIVVTNQPSIAKNIASFDELSTIHNKLETVLGNQGAKIDKIYFCPHHPQKGFPGERTEFKIDCDCRKPKPGMLLKAVEEFNIDPKISFIIGDTEADIQAGKSAGCYTIGVMTGYGLRKTTVMPDFFFSNLAESVDFILDKKYEPYFLQFKTKIEADIKKPYIIGIGGNARSGKSNFAGYIKMRLEQAGYKVLLIALDNWIIPELERSNIMNVFDRFRLLDIKIDLEKLIEGHKISVNSYPLHPERQSFEIVYNPAEIDVIIIEGVVALSSPQIRDFYSTSVFLTASAEKRKARFENYYVWKGKSKEEIETLFNTRITDEYELIEKDRNFAGLVIEN